MPSWKKLIVGFIEMNLTFLLFLLILALLTFILRFLGIDMWKILAGMLLSLGILSLVSGFVASFLSWVTHSIGWILANLHLNFLIITPLFFIKKIFVYIIYFWGRSSKKVRDFLDRMEVRIFVILEQSKNKRGKSI